MDTVVFIIHISEENHEQQHKRDTCI